MRAVWLQPMPHQNGRPCQVCGGLGVEDSFVTCDRCGAPEHPYCMRVLSFEIPDVWFCEECQTSKSVWNESVLASNDVRRSSSARNVAGPGKKYASSVMPKWKKIPGNTKVKLLSEAEAIKLASGEKRRDNLSRPYLEIGKHRFKNPKSFNNSSGEERDVLKSDKGSSPAERKVAGSHSQHRYIEKMAVAEKPRKELQDSSLASKQSLREGSGCFRVVNTNNIRERKMKARKEGRCTTLAQKPSSREGQEAGCSRLITAGYTPEREMAVKAKKGEQKSSFKHCSEDEKKAVSAQLIEPRCIEDTGTTVEATNRALHFSLAQKHYSNNTGVREYDASGQMDGKYENGRILKILPALNRYRRYLPALHAAWKGGLKFAGSAPVQDFYDGFQARPPWRVHRNAYKFIKKMSSMLHVEMLSLDSISGSIWRDEKPDLCDIAFYLFPDNAERSRQRNAQLFALLESRRSGIRSYVEGVELLIFTSKQLHVDSQSVIGVVKNMEEFLWGIFRSTTNSPSVGPQDEEGGMVADMEVDMVGGRRKTNKNPQKIETTITTAFPHIPPAFGQGSTLKSTNLADNSLPRFTIGSGIHSQRLTVPPYRRDSQDDEDEHCRTCSSREPCVRVQKPMGAGERWTAPPNNWVKLNVQGISKGDPGPSGAAGIVRDELGNWLFGYVHNLQSSERLATEFCAIYQGLNLLMERGYRRILVESACARAVQALLEGSTPRCPNSPLIRSCKQLLARDWECLVHFISNRENQCARKLCAKWLENQFSEHSLGLLLLTDPPSSLIYLLEREREFCGPPSLVPGTGGLHALERGDRLVCIEDSGFHLHPRCE